MLFPLVKVVAALLVASLAGCAAGVGPGGLAAHLGPPVYYCGEHGERFVARYGSLADGSLHFVKVKMPDGRQYTLPQVVSASGVRYTDERELVWWDPPADGASRGQGCGGPVAGALSGAAGSPGGKLMEEYLFDLRGYTVIPQALTRDHVAAIDAWDTQALYDQLASQGVDLTVPQL